MMVTATKVDAEPIGVMLPPRLAPIHIAIVPIMKAGKEAVVTEACEAVEKELRDRADELASVQERGGMVVEPLEDVSVTLHRGSFSSVIGSSGCGKSTLLRTVIGLVVPDNGRAVSGMTKEC